MKRYIAKLTSGVEIMFRASGTFDALNRVIAVIRDGEIIESLKVA